MFTGLVEAVGEIRQTMQDGQGLELVIAAPFEDLALGESISVDGACLTVAASEPGWFRVHVIRTSLDRTGFANYARGRRVNLERALLAGARLGGHLVQGHVDGIGTVSRIATREDARLMDLSIPPAVAEVSIPLGSVAVDGVSLTINAIPAPDTLQISLIPHTLEHTTLGDRREGDRVHLEADLIGKYVKHLLKGER
jgi:riboflavin synthase